MFYLYVLIIAAIAKCLIQQFLFHVIFTQRRMNELNTEYDRFCDYTKYYMVTLQLILCRPFILL